LFVWFATLFMCVLLKEGLSWIFELRSVKPCLDLLNESICLIITQMNEFCEKIKCLEQAVNNTSSTPAVTPSVSLWTSIKKAGLLFGSYHVE
jgi:hypothetical protein